MKIATMRADLPKPAYGDPCNGCGVCCRAVTCPTAQYLMGFTAAPCPALTEHEGAYRCGLILDPARWRPEHAAKYGAQRLRDAVLHFIGVDTGCDCRAIHEAPRPDLEARWDEENNATAVQWRELALTWGLPLPPGFPKED